jgi:hypothetical protein
MAANGDIEVAMIEGDTHTRALLPPRKEMHRLYDRLRNQERTPADGLSSGRLWVAMY